jgi:hypothetical protein
MNWSCVEVYVFSFPILYISLIRTSPRRLKHMLTPGAKRKPGTQTSKCKQHQINPLFVSLQMCHNEEQTLICETPSHLWEIRYPVSQWGNSSCPCRIILKWPNVEFRTFVCDCLDLFYSNNPGWILNLWATPNLLSYFFHLFLTSF